ncbi:hypothetical protein [Paenibacillus lautus]|uniref:hypothetical protein n=1 Tax=Paenibacillus lautus TaxID=1401 RepID=UPI003D27B0FF
MNRAQRTLQLDLAFDCCGSLSLLQCDEAEGEARLVDLWLRTFGPGTVTDISGR